MLKYASLSGLLLTLPVSAKPAVVSRIARTPEGRAYLEVDGVPFFYNAVQAWKSPSPEYLMDGGYAANLDKARDVGYGETVVAFKLKLPGYQPIRFTERPGTYSFPLVKKNQNNCSLEVPTLLK